MVQYQRQKQKIMLKLCRFVSIFKLFTLKVLSCKQVHLKGNFLSFPMVKEFLGSDNSFLSQRQLTETKSETELMSIHIVYMNCISRYQRPINQEINCAVTTGQYITVLNSESRDFEIYIFCRFFSFGNHRLELMSQNSTILVLKMESSIISTIFKQLLQK